MAISINITQDTGVVTTYHKARIGQFNLYNSVLSVNVQSYLNDTHTDTQGFTPISTSSIDVGFVLPSPAGNPPQGATIADVVQSIIENALIAQPSGMFFGGTIVA